MSLHYDEEELAGIINSIFDRWLARGGAINRKYPRDFEYFQYNFSQYLSRYTFHRLLIKNSSSPNSLSSFANNQKTLHSLQLIVDATLSQLTENQVKVFNAGTDLDREQFVGAFIRKLCPIFPFC